MDPISHIWPHLKTAGPPVPSQLNPSIFPGRVPKPKIVPPTPSLPPWIQFPQKPTHDTSFKAPPCTTVKNPPDDSLETPLKFPKPHSPPLPTSAALGKAKAKGVRWKRIWLHLVKQPHPWWSVGLPDAFPFSSGVSSSLMALNCPNMIANDPHHVSGKIPPLQSSFSLDLAMFQAVPVGCTQSLGNSTPISTAQRCP